MSPDQAGGGRFRVTDIAAAAQPARRAAGRISLRERCALVVESSAFVPVTLALAILIRLVWIATVNARPIDDFSWYFDRAVELAQGKGLVFRGEPTAYWPVGYPLFLAGLFKIFGVSLLAAKLANVVLYLGAMLCAYGIARRMFENTFCPRLVLLALALYPNQASYAALTATETPFLFLMLAGTLLLLLPGERLDRAALAGLVFGLGCLVKPTMLFIPAIVLAFEGLAGGAWRRLLPRAALAHLVLALTIAPWIVRNYRVYDAFVFIDNNGGINLLIGNNPSATGGYAEFGPELLRRLDAAPNEQKRDVLAKDLALSYIRENPLETLARLPMKIWYLYFKDVEGFYWNEMAIGRGKGTPIERPLAPLKIAGQVFWLAVLVSFFQGVVRLYVLGRPPFPSTARSALGLGIILYFTLISLAAFGSSRLHFPLAPFLVFHAAAWWSLLLDRLPCPAPRGALAGLWRWLPFRDDIPAGGRGIGQG